MPTNLAHLLHYGAGVLAICAGVLTMLGVHLPGVTVDPATAIVVGGGILGVGAKADAALKNILLPFAIALAALLYTGGIGDAYAADQSPVVKAPVRRALVPFDGTAGSYYGASTIGESTKISVPTSTADTGASAAVGAVYGYAWGNPANWFFLEGGVYKSAASSGVVDPTWTGRARLGWGGPAQGFLNLIPGPFNPTTSPVLTAPPSSTTFPYVYGVASADNLTRTIAKDMQYGLGGGIGLRQKLTADTAVDYFSDCTWSVGHTVVNGASQDRKCIAGFTVSH